MTSYWSVAVAEIQRKAEDAIARHPENSELVEEMHLLIKRCEQIYRASLDGWY
jgi:hypothetical protein